MSNLHSVRWPAVLGASIVITIALMIPMDALQGTAPGSCRIAGHVMSGTSPLPGVAISVKSGGAPRVVTSTDVDGGFSVSLTPGQYVLAAELTGFTRIEQPLTVATGTGECGQPLNLAMALAPRSARAAPSSAPAAAAQANTAAARGSAPPQTAGGRDRGNAPGQTGFQTVQVQQQTDATAIANTSDTEDTAAVVRQLLPPGFSPDASNDAIAINGSAASVDRGMMQDRFGAIGRGEFDPATGE